MAGSVLKKTVLAAVFVCVLLASGCRSVGVRSDLPEVNPLSLLSDDSSIYIRVPVRFHQELTASILQAEEPALSEKAAQQVVSRINLLYAGLATVKDRSRVQIAAQGSYPPVALKVALSKKNGWNRQQYVALSSPEALSLNFPNTFDYYMHEGSEFELSFPSAEMFVTAKKVHPLLEQYALRAEPADTEYNRWLSQQSDDILFYITRPGQYLRNLIGQSVSIGCDAIYGSLQYAPGKDSPDSYSGIYTMSFNIALASESAMRPMKALLTLSMAMMDVEVSQVDSRTLRLSGFRVSRQQIEALFTREAITGKHFKVVKGEVIEESRK